VLLWRGKSAWIELSYDVFGKPKYNCRSSILNNINFSLNELANTDTKNFNKLLRSHCLEQFVPVFRLNGIASQCASQLWPFVMQCVLCITLCSNTQLRFRNFSDAFIYGISRMALKIDAVSHLKSRLFTYVILITYGGFVVLFDLAPRNRWRFIRLIDQFRYVMWCCMSAIRCYQPTFVWILCATV